MKIYHLATLVPHTFDVNGSINFFYFSAMAKTDLEQFRVARNQLARYPNCPGFESRHQVNLWCIVNIKKCTYGITLSVSKKRKFSYNALPGFM
jgi:hypothetical protein